MRRLTAALLTLFFQMPLAHSVDFSGKWTGTGTYEESGWGTFSAHVEITIERSIGRLSTQDCWHIDANEMDQPLCSTYRFDVVGEELQLNGTKAGEIHNGTIEIAFNKGQKALKAQFSILPEDKANFSYSLTTPERKTRAVASDLTR
jgi:hypothetical protein